MAMTKNKSNAANQQYWKFVEETSRKVAGWPQWLRGTPSETSDRRKTVSVRKSAKKAK